MNLSGIKALGPWLTEGKYIWIGLAPILIALLILLYVGTSERAIRITGLVLQLLGVATIIWGIQETRRLFGHVTLTTKVKGWFQRFPLLRRNVVVAVGGASAVAATDKVRAFATHGAGPNPTVDARLNALERNIALIHERITATEKDIDDGLAKIGEEFKTEVRARHAADEELHKKIEATGTGGVHISAIGASWLFVGVLLSTAAPELAALVSRLYRC